MSFLHRKLQSLINDFEKAERRGGLSYGIFDREIRKFVLLLLEELTKNYEDDVTYFEIIEVVDDFFNQMHHSLSGAGWMVWTGIDFSRLSELNSGEKEGFEKVREIWDYYKHFGV